MKILTVTDTDEGDPIHRYVAKCTDDMFYDVETAFEELGIWITDAHVEEISQELMHGRNYWYKEHYCFEVVTVPEI